MKKLLLIIAALFINFNLLAQEITIKGIKYEKGGYSTNIYAKVIGYNSDDMEEDIEIKDIVNINGTECPVKVINDAAFIDATLNTVKIPNTIQKILDGAFYNTSIKEITIPKSVTTIGNDVFGNDYTSSLETLHCERETPPTIGDNAFGNNSDLKINVPEGCVSDYKKEWSAYANNIQGEDPIEFVGGGGNDDWNTTGNWVGLPAGGVTALADKNVIIKADAIIKDNAVIKVNKFKIDGGSITIQDGCQFIVQEESEGNVTMEMSISKYTLNSDNTVADGWYTISSPFKENYTLSANNFLVGTYELFRYNEATSMWENQKAHEDEFTALEPGKGYLYANKEGQTLYITGKPNINKQTINLTAQGTISELQGFNLIGNPFTHNIYKGEGASIDNKNLSNGYYRLDDIGKWETKLDSDPIEPMQGILVKTEADCSIEIGHSHKSPSAKRSDKGIICINVANNEYNDVAYVSFNNGIGLNKIEHRNNEIPMVYVPVDGIDYAIAIMDEDVEEIPVNFEAKKMGEYTIGISTEGRKYSKLTLIDKQDNNKEIDMLKGNYTFLATTTDDPARFILKASLNNNQEAAFYTENNSIIIDNMKGAATVHVYDVMGRPVMKYNTNDSNCQLSTSSLANGVYIIQLIDENGTQVQKVIVNN